MLIMYTYEVSSNLRYVNILGKNTDAVYYVNFNWHCCFYFIEKWKCYDFTSLEETAVNVAEAADFLNLVNSEMVVCNLVPLYRWYDGCGYCDHHCCIGR